MGDYLKEEIERKGVNLIHDFFAGRNGEIKAELNYNDKTETTDGFIRYDGHSFDVQVKSSGNEASTSIKKKYLSYAAKNDLIFINCSLVYSTPRIDYKILTKEKMIFNDYFEKDQETYTIRFEEINYSNFKKELEELISSRRIVKHVKHMSEFVELTKGSNISLKADYPKNQFNKKVKIIELKSIVTRKIGTDYIVKLSANNIIAEVASKQIQRKIENKTVTYSLTIDFDKHIRVEVGGNYFEYITNKDENGNELKIHFDLFNEKIENSYEQLKDFALLLSEIKQVSDEIEQYVLNIKNIINEYESFMEWYIAQNLEKYIEELALEKKKYIKTLYEFFSKARNSDLRGKKYLLFEYSYSDSIKLLFILLEKDGLFDITNAGISLSDGVDEYENHMNFIGVYFPMKNKKWGFKYNNLNIKSTLIKFFKNENLVEGRDETKKEFFSFGAINFIELLAVHYYIAYKDKEIYNLLENELKQKLEDDINFINYIQLKKHAKEDISATENERLREIKLSDDLFKKLCAIILLEEKGQKVIFNKLNHEEQEEFKSFPIYRLYRIQ